MSVDSGLNTSFSLPEKKKIGMCFKRAMLTSSVNFMPDTLLEVDEGEGHGMTVPLDPMLAKCLRHRKDTPPTNSGSIEWVSEFRLR